MILKTEFSPYFELSKHVRDTQIEPYIQSATAIDLFSALGKQKYEEIMISYKTEQKVLAIAGNIIDITDTSVFSNNENYLFCVEEKKRHKFTILNATQIQVDDSGIIAVGDTLTYFINYDAFEVIRAYLCHCVWLRYCQASKLQSTASGIVEKVLEQSEFVSDYSLATYLNLVKRDCQFYELKLVDFFRTNTCTRTKRIAYPIAKPKRV